MRTVRWIICLLGLVAPVAVSGAMLKHVESVQPRMGQRGTTVEVIIQGAHLKDPREVIFFKPGIRAVAIEPLPNVPRPSALMHGGRIDEQFKCRFEIAPDCVPGEHPFRVRTATELTSLATFHVSPFPVIEEAEKTANSNDTPSTAMPVSPNVTIRGTVSNSRRGDRDLYKVPATPGQRISVEVDCVRMADKHYGDAEYDLAASILDSKGRELAINDDNSMHQQDPVLSIQVPAEAGDHVFVEVRRSVFVSHEVHYAVHIGSFARPVITYPAGGQVGKPLEVKLLGDPLGETKASIALPAEEQIVEHFLDGPSPLWIRAFAHPNVMEEPSAPVTDVASLPIALNGILDAPNDKDAFRVRVKKGDRYRVRVYAASLGSPLDPSLRITPASGGKPEIEMDDADALLADRDIHGPNIRSRGGLKDVFDPSVIFEPKTDGEYLIEVRDTNGFGSATGVYRIEIETPPDTVYALLRSTAFDWVETGRYTSLAVPQGNRWTINLSLPAGQGTTYKGDLEIFADGLPKGVQLLASKVPGGSPLWPVQLIASPEAQPGGAVLTFGVRSTDPSKPLRSGSVQWVPFINHSGGDAWRAVKTDRFVMAVTDPAPFAMELAAPKIPLVRGGELAIPIKVTRRPGFDGPVEFKCDFAPTGVVLPPAEVISAGQSEGTLRISASADAKLGTGPLFVMATNAQDDGSYLGTGHVRVSSQIIDMTIAEPFVTLAAEPASVRRGGSSQFAWKITPKSGFEGEATVKLLGLPKGVSVAEPFPVITKDSKEVSFEVKATDEALLGLVSGLECELTVQAGGQEIQQRTGRGSLRVDPQL